MENFSNGVIKVHIDSKDKMDTTSILKDLELEMALNQVKPSDELEEALKETIIIENEFKLGKRYGYNNVDEMMKSILDD